MNDMDDLDLQLVAMKSIAIRPLQSVAMDFTSGTAFSNESQIDAKMCIVYLRVSTQRQGISGLGLEAQKEAVRAYLSTLPHRVVGEYMEVESGKRGDRPELQKALSECRRKKATLIIAKLDRLARNVHFISGMMQSGVDFIAVDNPHANKLMLHMLAAFAEHEREMISKRTIDALAAAKARGIKLGVNGARLAEKEKREADARAKIYYPMIRDLLVDHRSYRAVANRLNEMAINSPFGGRWHASSVRNMCLRSS